VTEIDNNEFRQWVERRGGGWPPSIADGILILCDALDAARAERDAYRKAKQENDERFQLEAGAQRERAEKAEAAIERVRALCDRAESDYRLGAEYSAWVDDVRAALDGEVS
jgi:hypothetical protein